MSDRIDTPNPHSPRPPVSEGAPSPWHAGEIRLQQILGVDARMEEVGRKVLRDHLIEQHRLFYPQLPFVVLGSVDPDGRPWATLRANKPGFLFATDIYHLAVTLPRDGNDPADAGMEDGDAIGLLGIELHTRRRNRLNGTGTVLAIARNISPRAISTLPVILPPQAPQLPAASMTFQTMPVH